MKARGALAGLAALAVLVGLMFFDVLLAPGTHVLGAAHADALQHFVPWSEFGFGELARGNLALWNPHVFGGAPYFAGAQSALLYPPNWLFLVLPLPLAVNWTVAINVFLLGAFMFAWALWRGLHPLAAFLCGASLMLCGPFFLHILPGHVAHVSAMVWLPLVLLAADAWVESRRRWACLLGMFAVAMQLFAGMPQYAFVTGVAAGFYVLFRDWRALPGLAAMYAGGVALAAVQLLPGIDAAQDSLRGRALPYSFTSGYAFPPENLLTLLAPYFFGGFDMPYWGRWFEWEASLYFGAVGLALAIYGMARGEARDRLPLIGAAAVAFLLALGAYTPLYALLYEHAPAFNRFRAIGRFVFPTAVFLVLFAGVALDRLMRQGVEKPLLRVLGAAALFAAGAGLAVHLMPWEGWMAALADTGDILSPASSYRDAVFVSAAAANASSAMLLAAAVLAAALAILVAVRAARLRALCLVALAVVELFVFARLSRETADIAFMRTPAIAETIGRDPGDYRVINMLNHNSAMSTRGYDIWGYDPGALLRYAEFVFWSEGKDPAQAIQDLGFTRLHPHLAMLRLRYVFSREPTGMLKVQEARAAPMKRLELIGAHRVLAGRDAIFAAMAEPGFDPRREVILERAPRPPPAAAANPGTARITREGTDFLEIEAKLEVPSVLLVTDTWASGWRAAGYEVMPANYALRAIPLGAGSHRILLEYAPRAFLVGVWISAIAWLLWLILLLRRPGW